jgi:hypothetical protein
MQGANRSVRPRSQRCLCALRKNSKLVNEGIQSTKQARIAGGEPQGPKSLEWVEDAQI